MKLTSNKKITSLLLCMMLIVAMALCTTGCSDNGQESNNTQETSANNQGETSVLGEGETQFFFTVVDKDGNETNFEINTNQTTVGAALLELELISGEDGDYGLYVKTVNGITADYDADGTYWAFYVNDEYASSGVDTTDIVAGEHYSFKVE